MSEASESTNRWSAPSLRALVLILLIGALIRIGLLWWWRHEPLRIYDEQDYNRLAVSLIERGEFALKPGDPCSARPPLYPAMVAGIYAVADRLPVVDRLNAVRIVQAGLGLLLTLQVYLLAARLYDSRIGLLAAGIACFYPSLLGFANLLLSEVLFSVLLLAAMLALQAHFRRPSYGRLALFGVWLGLATLTRSVLWPSFPFFAAYLILVHAGESWRSRFAFAAVAVLSFALVLAPWAVRNTRLQNTFVPVDVLGGRNMMMGNYEHTAFYRSWATMSQAKGERSWHRTLAREHPDYYQKTQGQRDKLAMRRGFQYVFEHPAVTAQRDLVKFINFWQLERTLVAGLMFGWWGDLPRPAIIAAAAVIMGGYALVQIAGIYGFVMTPPGEKRLHWGLLLVTLFVCGVHTLVFAHSRYHLSLMPLVFPYAAAAVLGWRSIWNRLSGGRFVVATAITLLLAASWLWQTWYLDLPKLQSRSPGGQVRRPVHNMDFVTGRSPDRPPTGKSRWSHARI